MDGTQWERATSNSQTRSSPIEKEMFFWGDERKEQQCQPGTGTSNQLPLLVRGRERLDGLRVDVTSGPPSPVTSRARRRCTAHCTHPGPMCVRMPWSSTVSRARFPSSPPLQMEPNLCQGCCPLSFQRMRVPNWGVSGRGRDLRRREGGFPYQLTNLNQTSSTLARRRAAPSLGSAPVQSVSL